MTKISQGLGIDYRVPSGRRRSASGSRTMSTGISTTHLCTLAAARIPGFTSSNRRLRSVVRTSTSATSSVCARTSTRSGRLGNRLEWWRRFFWSFMPGGTGRPLGAGQQLQPSLQGHPALARGKPELGLPPTHPNMRACSNGWSWSLPFSPSDFSNKSSRPKGTSVDKIMAFIEDRSELPIPFVWKNAATM
jgi:hypothetical protein